MNERKEFGGAQSVERWTPYGGSIRPGFQSPGFEARRAPDVY